jgi:hypothetical protein
MALTVASVFLMQMMHFVRNELLQLVRRVALLGFDAGLRE